MYIPNNFTKLSVQMVFYFQYLVPNQSAYNQLHILLAVTILSSCIRDKKIMLSIILSAPSNL